MGNNQDERQSARAMRIANYEAMRTRMCEQGYQEHSKTISVIKANLMALVTAGPIAAVAAVIFFSKWGELSFFMDSRQLTWFVILMLAAIPIHELIHGATWALLCKDGFRSVHIGVMRPSMTPYCYCKEPLRFGEYFFGGIMPLMVLGIALYLVALFTGNTTLLLLSLFNIIGAGGDTTILLMLLKYRGALILDHPTACGFVAFTKV